MCTTSIILATCLATSAIVNMILLCKTHKKSKSDLSKIASIEISIYEDKL